MTTRVDEGVQLAIPVAYNKDGLADHISCEVVVLVGDLALVGEIDPVALEDVLHFEFEDLRVGKDVSGDPVGPLFGIVFQHRVERFQDRIVHLFPPRPRCLPGVRFASRCRGATSRSRCCESKTKLVGTIPRRYRLELRQLRYFAAVARERNFTRAAETLHIVQPPLSRQMQQLEDELGGTLIERGSRPLRLTDAGRLLYEQTLP